MSASYPDARRIARHEQIRRARRSRVLWRLLEAAAKHWRKLETDALRPHGQREDRGRASW